MTDLDPRAAPRLDFVRRSNGRDDIELERASADAGFRSYWRTRGLEPSRIVMDSPPDKEDVRPWLAVRELLLASGVRVPAVHASDVDAGFLLLEDLGRDTCLMVIDSNNADALFDQAITQLLRVQKVVPPSGFPRYDEALLARELELFGEWFLGRHLGIHLDARQSAALAGVHRHLIDAMLAQPQVLVHRDYMPRNLMPQGADVAVLDFQDAVLGPLAYDPICLFKDAFLSWPEARVHDWLAHYHARASDAGLPLPALARFRRDADLTGVHRHLKVIGIFARLNYRDGKPRYLADVARFIAYLDHVLPCHAELAPLADLIEQRVKPAMRELDRTAACAP
ncbi:MAG TPA: phosphotransferase [Rhodanobacteraceae bacterium]|nr:phosphotransferase [Rhodanobacteraceae bacterium]